MPSRPPTRLRWIAVSLGIAALVVGGGPRNDLSARPVQKARPNLEGGVDWINTDRPIHLDRLRGKVVLLDFWTYCCINCHHIIPTLNRLEEKYKNQLVVVGVHTAKFDAEKVTENIRKKVREYNIKHPVLNDANQVVWNNFGVQAWPTLAVIDADGELVARQGGEVSFEILDEFIGKLVAKARAAGTLDETPIQFFPEREKTHTGPLLFPGKVVADGPGKRLFITDTGHNRIVVTDLDGKGIDVIGNGLEALADGAFDKASLNRPQGVCLVGDTLYIADTENHALRAADLKARTIKTVAGNGKQAEFGAAGGQGTAISLSSPWDVLPIPGTTSLALAMAGTHQIWSFDLKTSAVRVLAGSGRENIVDGSPMAAAFAQPSGLATDGKHLFVADSEVSGVRSIALGEGGDRVDRIVGIGLFGFGDVDGQGPAVRLQHCLGVAYGGDKLYIADSYNNKVKVCDPRTKSVHTLAAGFDEPGGLSVLGTHLFVADTNGHAIKVVDLGTKEVRPLKLEGVSAPNTRRAPRFPNATVASAAPVSVAPGEGLTLTIPLALPEGYDLNKDAPLTYLVEVPDRPGALSPKNPTTGGRIESPRTPVSIPVPLSAEAKAGETLTVKVSLQAMVCLPNTLCTVKNYVWTVPVTLTEGAPSTATVGAK